MGVVVIMGVTEENEAGVSITLVQFCRALAAQVLLSSHPDLLHSVMAPETAERTAQFIHRFALGESVTRPELGPLDDI